MLCLVKKGFLIADVIQLQELNKSNDTRKSQCYARWRCVSPVGHKVSPYSSTWIYFWATRNDAIRLTANVKGKVRINIWRNLPTSIQIDSCHFEKTATVLAWPKISLNNKSPIYRNMFLKLLNFRLCSFLLNSLYR